MHKKQKGFTVLDGILIVIVLALVTFGWYAFQAKKKAEDNAAKKTAISTTQTTTKAKHPSIPDGWTWYDNKDIGYAFAYPKAWTFVANQPETCPFDVKLYGSTSCPLTIKLSPQDFIDDKRNSPDSSLIGSVVYAGDQLVSETDAEAYEINQAKAPKAKVERQETYQVRGQNVFYVRSVTDAWIDNVWVVQFKGYYVRFANRERNTEYYSDGRASFITDYSRYTATIERIVKTTIALDSVSL
jgi:hypothetical protein